MTPDMTPTDDSNVTCSKNVFERYFYVSSPRLAMSSFMVFNHFKECSSHLTCTNVSYGSDASRCAKKIFW